MFFFDLAKGKDFVLFVKEIQTGDETYPDYKMSMFKQDTTSLPVFIKEKEFSKTHQLLMVKLIQQHKVKLKLSYLIENTNLKSLSLRN
jgi:hypothetical protein